MVTMLIKMKLGGLKMILLNIQIPDESEDCSTIFTDSCAHRAVDHQLIHKECKPLGWKGGGTQVVEFGCFLWLQSPAFPATTPSQ